MTVRFVHKTQCPECKKGHVVTSEIHRGATCDYCRALIEFDARITWGLPVIVLLVTLFFLSLGMIELGIIATILLIFWTAGYQNVLARYLPLKCYHNP